MRGLVIRLGILLIALLALSQLLLPAFLEDQVESRLTDHGGKAKVGLSAVPALRLLFGHGDSLDIRASGLSVDLQPGQQDVFKQLDKFGDVKVAISNSRAGPFTVSSFWLNRRADHQYDVIVSGDANAADVARYAGAQLAGGFGQALAGLATGAIAGFNRPIPVSVRMRIDTTQNPPRATNVQGDVAGLPAGALVQIVTNALLGSL
jgi:hypothetical protein